MKLQIKKKDATLYAKRLTDAKLYASFVPLSSQDNTKLLQQSKSRFKRIIFCNKYKLRVLAQTQNQYLDYLIDPRFQWVGRLFLYLFHKRYFLPTV